MIAVALMTGAWIAARPEAHRPSAEVWTFAESHADLYRSLTTDVNHSVPQDLTVRLIPNNALNVRLISLLMAGRSGSELPDVVEIRQDAIGRYLGPPAEQIGLLPLNDLLAAWSLRQGRPLDQLLVGQRLMPYTKGGQVFGLPRDIHPVLLAYRADLFAEAGVDLESPTPGCDFVTWQDFRQRCLRFQHYWNPSDATAQGTARWAMDLFAANADILAALLLQRGVNLIEPDGRLRLTDPVVVDTVAFYASLAAGPQRISTDSVAAGRSVWGKDLTDGTVCALVAPDWRLADLRSAAPSLAGRWRVTRLPRFAPTDAATTSWGGTMVAIPRRCRDPQASWKIIESLYLSERAVDTQIRQLGILPAVLTSQKSVVVAAVDQPDAYFGGQPVLRHYAEVADQIPPQHLTPDTAYATAALGFVLSKAIAAVRDGRSPDDPAFRSELAEWLSARQEDVRRQVEHGALARPRSAARSEHLPR